MCLERPIFVPEWSLYRLAVVSRSSRFRLESGQFRDEGKTRSRALPGSPGGLRGGPKPTTASRISSPRRLRNETKLRRKSVGSKRQQEKDGGARYRTRSIC